MNTLNAFFARPASFVLSLFLLCCFEHVVAAPISAGGGQDLAELKKVVARVGDAVITETELRAAAKEKVNTLYSHGQDLSVNPEYRRKALDELIEIELFVYEAAKRGMKPPEAHIDETVALNIRQLGSEEALHQELRRHGLDMESFRGRIMKYRMANELLAVIIKESAYSEEELNKYYTDNLEKFRRPDSMHLRSILLKVAPNALEAEWQTRGEAAEGLLKRIKAGEDFFNLAYYNSDDESRVKGGDLGFVHKGMLEPEELNAPAFSLKKGEVSGVIRTNFGFHIIKAEEIKAGEIISFEAAKKKLSTELHQSRFNEKKASLLRQIREEHPVTVFIPLGDN